MKFVIFMIYFSKNARDNRTNYYWCRGCIKIFPVTFSYWLYRFKHVAVRSHAEQIGFYNSGFLENALTNRKLSSLLDTQTSLVNPQFFLWIVSLKIRKNKRNMETVFLNQRRRASKFHNSTYVRKSSGSEL